MSEARLSLQDKSSRKCSSYFCRMPKQIESLELLTTGDAQVMQAARDLHHPIGKPAFVRRKTSLTWRQCLTPEMACSTTTHVDEKIRLTLLSPRLNALTVGF